ncbi:MAG: DegT/DnrJ/EryC1/StrS aminotransferase family protein [Bacteroidota bacterium]
MIKLVQDTIDQTELEKLSKWICQKPQLTKGSLTSEFENTWSSWLGMPFSVFTNSGSSANLLMFDALIQGGRLKSKNIIVPAVSWVTTVAPIIQLGLNPVLCDADETNLGLNLEHFEELLKNSDIGAVIIVHVLGVPNHMDEIMYLCKKYNTFLLEDSCEAVGSTYKGKMVGTFGGMSSFSFYFGHHMSTIEGGMISCNDEDLYSIVLSIRSHGWARDLPPSHRISLEKEFNIDSFTSLYTFYYPGYNFRSSDLNAFLGKLQLEKMSQVISRRNENYNYYKSKLEKSFWTQENTDAYISNFAFGLIDERRSTIVKRLQEGGVETRPLICGSIGLQPFWIKIFGPTHFKVADRVHKYGFYVPNNHQITKTEMDSVIDILLSV